MEGEQLSASQLAHLLTQRFHGSRFIEGPMSAADVSRRILNVVHMRQEQRNGKVKNNAMTKAAAADLDMLHMCICGTLHGTHEHWSLVLWEARSGQHGVRVRIIDPADSDTAVALTANLTAMGISPLVTHLSRPCDRWRCGFWCCWALETLFANVDRWMTIDIPPMTSAYEIIVRNIVLQREMQALKRLASKQLKENMGRIDRDSRDESSYCGSGRRTPGESSYVSCDGYLTVPSLGGGSSVCSASPRARSPRSNGSRSPRSNTSRSPRSVSPCESPRAESPAHSLDSAFPVHENVNEGEDGTQSGSHETEHSEVPTSTSRSTTDSSAVPNDSVSPSPRPSSYTIDSDPAFDGAARKKAMMEGWDDGNGMGMAANPMAMLEMMHAMGGGMMPGVSGIGGIGPNSGAQDVGSLNQGKYAPFNVFDSAFSTPAPVMMNPQLGRGRRFNVWDLYDTAFAPSPMAMMGMGVNMMAAPPGSLGVPGFSTTQQS